VTRRATVKDLRQRNRTAVLRRMILGGQTTRTRLAADCGLSAATVSNVVADLIRDGLVRESGSLPSDGGRPVARLSVEPGGAYFVGADVGEHGIIVELFDLSLRRVDRVVRQLLTRVVSPDAVADALSGALDEILSERSGVAESLIGVGLGLPGVVDVEPNGSATLYAQSLGWEPVRIEDVFHRPGVPTFADNGAKTLATAESWFGAAYGVSHAAVVLIGRGIGAGVITGGRILRGLSSSAGEWGHTKVSLGGPTCQCGARGCLEAYVGGGAIIRRWREAGATIRTADERALVRLIAAAEDGDVVARRVLDETIEILGVGLANLVNLFNPEQIVIGGWAGSRLLATRGADLSRAVRHYSLHRPGEQVRIDPCKLGDDAVALGAALLPLDQLIEGTLPAPKAIS
jgi:predicted NBD/HSP70 family sugar kinase